MKESDFDIISWIHLSMAGSIILLAGIAIIFFHVIAGAALILVGILLAIVGLVVKKYKMDNLKIKMGLESEGITEEQFEKMSEENQNLIIKRITGKYERERKRIAGMTDEEYDTEQEELLKIIKIK